LFRALHGDDEKDDGQLAAHPPALDEWLALIELERQVVIMQLRHYDGILVKHGRLRSFTLPQRTVR
jgi:hypothetical protein